MYLLDTNICIYIIKKKPPEVLATLKTKSKSGIAVSSLTVAELEYGIEKSEAKEKNRISLIELLSIFTIIPFDDKDAVEYGRIRTDLEKKGTVIGDIDMLPAAQARCKKLIFVTKNTKKFNRVENLRLENWVDTLSIANKENGCLTNRSTATVPLSRLSHAQQPRQSLPSVGPEPAGDLIVMPPRPVNDLPMLAK